MLQDMERFLNLKAPPGRLTAEQAAWFLGFSAHEIPMLVNKGLLKPLGRPKPNSDKYFAAVKLAELRQDEQWLSRATQFISQHYNDKNARKSKNSNRLVSTSEA